MNFNDIIMFDNFILINKINNSILLINKLIDGYL